jgi:hypothetical protein
MRQSQDGGGSRGVVVGTVVDGVAVDGRPLAQVIEVSGQKDDLIRVGTATQDSDGVPGLFAWYVLELREVLLKARGKRRGERRFLKEGSVVTSGLQSQRLKLGGGKESGDVLVASG